MSTWAHCLFYSAMLCFVDHSRWNRSTVDMPLLFPTAPFCRNLLYFHCNMFFCLPSFYWLMPSLSQHFLSVVTPSFLWNSSLCMNSDELCDHSEEPLKKILACGRIVVWATGLQTMLGLQAEFYPCRCLQKHFLGTEPWPFTHLLSMPIKTAESSIWDRLCGPENQTNIINIYLFLETFLPWLTTSSCQLWRQVSWRAFIYCYWLLISCRWSWTFLLFVPLKSLR